MIEAKVIADSVASRDRRLTTLEVNMNRFVLAEFNTHRLFSRSSASSRAIPFTKQVDRVIEDCAYPAVWASEQKGMQGGEELPLHLAADAEQAWHEASLSAVKHAQHLAGIGVHKSIVNRLLEPFMWHRVIVSSTCWENFFRQRCSPLAQPEIRLAAEAMRDAIDKSTPEEIDYDGWHMPYVDVWGAEGEEFDVETAKQVSAARCARVSYLTHDGKRDPQVDLELYAKLTTADPPHWAPLEHVATPTPEGVYSGGNFHGWTQLRSFVERERGIETAV